MAKSPCFIGHLYQSYVSHNQRLPEGIPPPFLKHPEPQPHFAWPVSDAPLNGLISRTDYRKICGFRRFFIFFPHQSIEDFHVALRILSFNTSKTGSETTGTGGNSLLAGQFFNWTWRANVAQTSDTGPVAQDCGSRQLTSIKSAEMLAVANSWLIYTSETHQNYVWSCKVWTTVTPVAHVWDRNICPKHAPNACEYTMHKVMPASLKSRQV